MPTRIPQQILFNNMNPFCQPPSIFMLTQQQFNFNLIPGHKGVQQYIMLNMQKSGQKIKAKVSKSPFTINGIKRTQSRHVRNSSEFSSYASEADGAPPEEEIKDLDEEAKERQEVFKYFKIPLDFKFDEGSDEYYHRICKNRINEVKYSNNIQLDARDQRLVLPFNSQYLPTLIQSKYKQSLEPLLDQLRDWLIDLIEITTSVSFNHLKKGHLTDKEVKNYAAKYILYNIKQTLENLDMLPMKERNIVVKYINTESHEIFKNIIQKYPQTGSRGASRRVKSKIRRIDNRENDQYDFLYKNDLKISYRKSGDYSEDIMKIINKLISFSTDTFYPNNQNEETNFQVFTEIIEYIFENASSQPCNTTVSDIAEIISRKMRAKSDSFLFSSTNISELRDALSFSERVQKKSSYSKDYGNKDYLIGHKIPSGTQLFTEQQLQGGNFKVNDSSILRILTKWAEELRQKLQNAEETLSKRAHKFKTKNGKFVNLEVDMRQLLYFAAQEQEKKIEDFMVFLQKENNSLQTIISEQRNIGKYSKHDVKVGAFAAKINEAASHYMFKYINKLIHALLTIPKIAARDIETQSYKSLLLSVDLLTMKIGDLMRGKYSCNEQEFLKVLSVFEELDCKHPQIFKIVRIKNRLDSKDNDVLINIYFMDKVQCQIQLAIKGTQNKIEKDYSNFNHFLYEIIRSKLGPISELANIVCQYDPLIHNFKKMRMFSPEILQTYWTKQKKKKINANMLDRLKFKKETQVGKWLDLPFICSHCFHLTIVNNPKFYHRDPTEHQIACNYCQHKNMINTEDTCEQGYEYIGEFNFKNNIQLRQFNKKHLHFWDFDKTIKQMQAAAASGDSDEQCQTIDIPSHGYYVKKLSKLPKLTLFSSTFVPRINSFILTSVDEKGNKKMITKMPMYLQKKKRIKALKNGMANIYIFQFQNVRKRVVNGSLQLKCTDPKCCGKEVTAGPVINREEIINIAHMKAIQCHLNSQKSLIDLNNIPKAFEKLQTALIALQDPQKIERVERSIHHIKAFSCSLQNIQMVSRFVHLADLNINDNTEIKSLRGLQNCVHLKSLQCKNCDLSSIQELSSLRKLESLNLSSNVHLRNLKGLEEHTEIIQMNISNTPVSSLMPLEKCLKLESLDLYGCQEIQTLSYIKSKKIAYLNIIDCHSLTSFDLQCPCIKSLKSVQYYKKSSQKIGMELVMASLATLNDVDDEIESDTQKKIKNHQETISKINQFLKSNKKDPEKKQDVVVDVLSQILFSVK